MAVKYTRPRGTQDVLPNESWKWQSVEKTIQTLARNFGYGEFRVPTFESTDLFARGIGDVTDVVSKEMYTFTDKGGRSVTLRPEGTAGVARAVLENGLLASSPLPLKGYYVQSNFRYEKAQKGRLREFHQFGVECFGSQAPDADVEVMQVAAFLFKELGVWEHITLEINSIGCPKCRPAFHTALKDYFAKHMQDLCPTCQERFERNPLRILDCKEKSCQKIAADAPLSLDHLCEECSTHFDEVQHQMQDANLNFTVNPRIVRGLDYYTKTVFEFLADGVGTQGTVCGGGRYDGLIESLGGQSTPAVGFGLGLERLLMLLQEVDALPKQPEGPVLYVAGLGEAGRKEARRIVYALRAVGLVAEHDIAQRSVKAQMKAAGRSGARYTMVLGDDEVAAQSASLKHMQGEGEQTVKLEHIIQLLTEL